MSCQAAHSLPGQHIKRRFGLSSVLGTSWTDALSLSGQLAVQACPDVHLSYAYSKCKWDLTGLYSCSTCRLQVQISQAALKIYRRNWSSHYCSICINTVKQTRQHSIVIV